MLVGRGAARLLLVVVAFAVTVAGVARRPRSKPTKVYRPNMDSVQLLKHVMKREKQWTDVLNEPVKLLGEPPYSGRKFNAPPVLPPTADDADPESIVYDIRDIVATITGHYIEIRSFAEYGAKGVRRALGCYTSQQLLFQFKCLSLMMEKNAKQILVLNTADELRDNVAAYIDVLSAVADKQLSQLLAAYWNAVELTQYEGVQHFDRAPYPPELTDANQRLTEAIGEFISDNCHPYKSEEEFFRKTRIPRKILFGDPSLDLLLTIDDMVDMTKKQSQHMSRYVWELGISTMPDNQWTSLFYGRGRGERPENDGDLHETDPTTSQAGPSSEHPVAEPPPPSTPAV